MQQSLLEIYNRNLKLTPNTKRKVVTLTLVTLWLISIVPLYNARNFNIFSATWFHPIEGKVIGKYLDNNIPYDWLIAIEWAGIIPFYTHQPILDTLGLNDRDVLAKSTSFLSVGRRASLEYLNKREPKIVVPCLRTFDTSDKALKSVLTSYDETGKKIRGSCRYWKYLDLASKNYNYNICIIEVSKNKYWPAIIRNNESNDFKQCIN